MRYKHKKGERYITSTLLHIWLINATMSLLLAVSHENVLSRMPQSSLRIPHTTVLSEHKHEHEHEH